MTVSRRTAIVPRVVMTATAAAVAPLQIIACSSDSSPTYIALAVGAYGGTAGEGGTGGKAGAGGTGGKAGAGGIGGHGGAEVMMGGAGGTVGTAGHSSFGGGFIVLAAAAFGGEAGRENQ